MAIRVFTVPQPAVGHDWKFTIPGEWNVALIGVVATIGTAAALTTFADETGNGHTATIDNATTGYQVGAPGPYAGGANNFALFGSAPFNFNSRFALSAISAAFNTPNASVEFLMRALPLPASQDEGNGAGIFSQTNNNSHYFWWSDNVGTNPAGAGLDRDGAVQFTVNNVISRNVWHHFATTYDGVNWRLYIDGNLVNTHAGAALLVDNGVRAYIGSSQGGGHLSGWQAGVAFYGATLTPGQISNHASALGSWQAYRAAVLADAPIAFYGMNTIPTMATRIVDLLVTDGTFTLSDFPASFASATVNSTTWAWQVLGSGALASSDGTTNVVPIPELYLPPGYTVGTRTLDLGGTDQWENITLYFDDGTGENPTDQPGFGADGYLNAMLVPEYPF